MRPAFSVGEAAAPPPHASLAAAILAGVERFPQGRFVHFDRDDGTRAFSYAQTLARARRLVTGLRDAGMGAGDGLLLAIADAAEAVPALWAAALGGFVAVPFVPSARSGTAAIPDRETLTLVGEIFGGFRVLSDAAATDDPMVLDLGRLVCAPPSPDAAPVAGQPGDLRFAIPTSGTTARPKLVGLSDGAALARWWPDLPDAGNARGFLSWSSLGHVMGLGLAMPNLPLKAHLDAARFVADPLSWLDAIEAAGATHATTTNFGMSLVIRAIAGSPDRRWRLDHVRKIGIGAEAISRRTCDRFLKTLTPFGLREDALILGYGLSECGPVAGGATPFSGSGFPAADSPPELDRPTRGHAVRIVGDNGYLLREGETGSIEVRGPTMTSGYLGDETATADLFTPDRWLRTGDLGFLREGKLTVVGREKEIVVVNARKHTCQEIEAAVTDRTGLAEVYVAPLDPAGDPGKEGPGAPCAIFVVREPADGIEPVAEAVRAASAEAFRFAPRAVALISRDDLPRTPLGKVRRMALPAMLSDPDAADRVSYLTEKSAAADQAAGDAAIEAGIERRIARIWRTLLRSEGEIDRHADFFASGGDSLLALRMSFLLENEFGVPVQIERLAAKLSIAELARTLSGAAPQMPAKAPPSPGRLPDWMNDRLRDFLKTWPGTPALPDGLIRRLGSAQHGLPVFWCMQNHDEARSFGETLGDRLPAYAMRSGIMLLDYGTPLAEALADRYVEEIGRIRPEGPLVVAGTCQGVKLALAMTRRLVAEGREVKLLAAADCRFAEICGAEPVPVPVALFGAVRSKLSPFRYFRYPQVGLRKLAPHGLRLDMIDAAYAKIMLAPAMTQLAQGLEDAIGWALARDPVEPGKAVAAKRRGGMYRRDIACSVKTMALRPGERRNLDLRLENTSSLVWEPFEKSGLTVGNHWLSEDGAMVTWSDGRTPLTRRVKRGEQVRVTLEIVAPHSPGGYLLEVDMVEEGVCWFADVTPSPLQIPVQVVPRSLPRAPAPFRDWIETLRLPVRRNRRSAV